MVAFFCLLDTRVLVALTQRATCVRQITMDSKRKRERIVPLVSVPAGMRIQHVVYSHAIRKQKDTKNESLIFLCCYVLRSELM